MPKILSCCTLLLAILLSHTASARDTRLMLSIADALATPEAKAQLSGDIQFVFGAEAEGEVDRRFGTFTTNKKTNAFNKTDTEACQWVFLSAMVTLQQRARNEGGNAVVNIQSYYKKNQVSSTTEFECGAGSFVAGVALRGDVVTL